MYNGRKLEMDKIPRWILKWTDIFYLLVLVAATVVPPLWYNLSQIIFQ